MVLDHKLDTTSTNRSRAHISRYVNIQLSELGIVDVWRDMHLLDRDYTYYLHRYSTYYLVCVFARHSQTFSFLTIFTNFNQFESQQAKTFLYIL